MASVAALHRGGELERMTPLPLRQTKVLIVFAEK